MAIQKQTTLDSIDTETNNTVTAEEGETINEGKKNKVGVSENKPSVSQNVETWQNKSDYSTTITDILSIEVSIGSKPVKDELENDKQQEETAERTQREIKPISNHAKRFGSNTDSDTTVNEDTTSKTGSSVVVQEKQAQENSTEKNNGVEVVTKERDSVVGDELIDKQCSDCGGCIEKRDGDHYCVDCGMLYSDKCIDPGPDWRAYDSKEKNKKSRVGSPIKENIHDKGLSTVIGKQNTDAMGKQLSNKKKREMDRLRKWDRRFKVKDSKERNLRQAFGEIQRVSSAMELPDYVEETACTVYRRAVEEELLPGRSIESMTSACVHIAMRQASIPKTLDSLNEYTRVSKSKITGAYSYVCKELNIKVKPPEVLEYLSGIASKLDVSRETEKKAEELLQLSVEENIHSGKDPSGMAASAVYAATMITRKDRITQKMASESGDVCELTIRNRNRELLEAYGLNYDDISPPSKREVRKNNR